MRRILARHPFFSRIFTFGAIIKAIDVNQMPKNFLGFLRNIKIRRYYKKKFAYFFEMVFAKFFNEVERECQDGDRLNL